MTGEGYAAGLQDDIAHQPEGAETLEAREKSSSLRRTVEERVALHSREGDRAEMIYSKNRLSLGGGGWGWQAKNKLIGC